MFIRMGWLILCLGLTSPSLAAADCVQKCISKSCILSGKTKTSTQKKTPSPAVLKKNCTAFCVRRCRVQSVRCRRICEVRLIRALRSCNRTSRKTLSLCRKKAFQGRLKCMQACPRYTAPLTVPSTCYPKCIQAARARRKECTKRPSLLLCKWTERQIRRMCYKRCHHH